MFCSPNGELLMDVIIPHHRLDEMLGNICESLKIKNSLAQQNVSLLKDAKDIPETLKNEMTEFYAKDFALFEQLDEINAVGMEKLGHIARWLFELTFLTYQLSTRVYRNLQVDRGRIACPIGLYLNNGHVYERSP
jgi:hypothetical protein